MFSYYDRNSRQWKRGGGIPVRRVDAGVNKWREGLFEGHDEGMDEDHIQLEQWWRSTESDKWDVIDSGNWIQKTVWNRMVTGELEHLMIETRSIDESFECVMGECVI